jgi:hypothetical protein
LLVSAQFTAQSYNIILTDLANVWTESLDKKPIIMRGLKEDTSIDPTDGPDQIRKLLDLIRAAFDPSAPEHGDTSLALSKSDKTDEEGNLEIHVSVVLPKPLRPLKWPIYLQKGPQSAIATELVLPLIHAYQARAQEVDELITSLKEKDGVITKVTDKLEASGIGLENVFTALSGRRKVTRAVAEERIRGLAPFKESEFRKHAEIVEREGDDDDMLALLDSVFGAGPSLPSGSAMDIGESPALNDWWSKLGKGRTAALVSRGKDRGSAASSKANSQAAAPAPPTKVKPDEDEEETASEDDDDFEVQPSPPGKKDDGKKTAAPAREDDEGDDFQVQSTPPPKVGSNTRASQARDDDEEADEDFEVQATPPSRKRDGRHGRATRVLEDDGDDETSGGEEAEIPDSMPSVAAKEATSKATGKRLGAIGGKKKQQPEKKTPPAPEPSPSPPRTRSHPAPAADDDIDDAGSATASDTDDSPPAPPPPKSSQATRRGGGGGGIGRIGGRKAPAKESTPDPRSSTPPAAASSQQHQPQAQTPRRRLGVIGKKAPDSGGGRGRGRTKTPPGGHDDEEEGDDEDEERQKRETSEERAERRRAELKRELEEKRSHPLRKKRKF